MNNEQTTAMSKHGVTVSKPLQIRRLAFVTCENIGCFDDDKIAEDTLSCYGFSVESIPWDAMDVDWQSYDGIILRSAWDYHLKYEEFESWLGRIEQIGVPFFNQLKVVRWNIHKQYLQELERYGIQIPRTHFITERSSNFPELRSLMKSSKLRQVVIKPSISCNGYKTILAKSMADGQRHLNALLKERDVMVQEFIPEVLFSGEISLVYFNRVYSHVVAKTSQSEESRADRNAPTVSHEPSDAARAAAQAILDQVPGSLLYARVDMVKRDSGDFVLMEVEVIEPKLYFAGHRDAANNFVKALLQPSHFYGTYLIW